MFQTTNQSLSQCIFQASSDVEDIWGLWSAAIYGVDE